MSEPRAPTDTVEGTAAPSGAPSAEDAFDAEILALLEAPAEPAAAAPTAADAPQILALLEAPAAPAAEEAPATPGVTPNAAPSAGGATAEPDAAIVAAEEPVKVSGPEPAAKPVLPA